jgi:hypothetical protein
MKFDFYSNKAVYKYAKLWGFTKSSPGQTDIEFEMGLTPEEAAEETIQSLKRRAVKLAERKKWIEVQKDADKWNDFSNKVFYPMKDWIEENLPKYRPPKIKLDDKPSNFCAVVGISDWHYLKYAYDNKGKPTYDRKIARRELKKANDSLIRQMLRHGKPERIIIPNGNDNLTVDNIFGTTTAGTSQHGQIDGSWELGMQTYVDVVIGMIELYAQIAPVTVVPVPGNHDRHTSIMLHVFVEKYFEDREDVTVVRNPDSRIYEVYGRNMFMFTHGDHTTLPKLKKDIHKFCLVEPKQQKFNLNKVDNFYSFSGHIHTDSFEDMGGVKHFVIPSIAPPDNWHKEKGYVGNRLESSLYLFDKKHGRIAIFYS